MTSRRITSQEKTPLERDAGSSAKSDIAPAVPALVVYKLLGFTLGMVVVPIGTYFATVDLFFRGNATYAGGLAAFMANVVLIAYVIVAMKEDQSEKMEAEQKAKKAQ
ncbi:Vacuolar ATPase assembly integral membrane protein VMA21 [Endocarpon pusillum Z07020]|uniref:Vacuolar ATPase assembly integral membrane protein VMA21 n=1 Tax=Endocarpon pusillum (strain Z07020 / HMAS-L-300199) TaxID=1263415 RepID=U1HI72_ENDPU|nr:Vacuolar ATPase assembly integral membrane protein VMA21 [Endocarpon pusillum Z07020]ERF68579.1 Vacuolar ATPase assembly integral membrane protein VMA21 [Endocarpon pusillum Z07020]